MTLPHRTNTEEPMQDLEENNLRILFASEKPVRHWLFRGFILKCAPEACNLVRLTNHNLPYLFNHDRDFQGGQIQNVEFSGKKAYANLTWSESVEYTNEYRNVKQGIRPGSSPGLVVDEYSFYEEDKEDVFNSIIMATKWELVEISSVTAPANPETGIVEMAIGQNDIHIDESLAIKNLLKLHKEGIVELDDGPEIEPEPTSTNNDPEIEPEITPETTIPEEYSDVSGIKAELEVEPEPAKESESSVEEAEVVAEVEVQTTEVETPEPENLQVSDGDEIVRLSLKYGDSAGGMEYLAAKKTADEYRTHLLSLSPVRDLRNQANQNRPQEFMITRLFGAQAYPAESQFQKNAAHELEILSNQSNVGENGQQIAQGNGTLVRHETFTQGAKPLYGNKLQVEDLKRMERLGMKPDEIQLAVNSTGVSSAILDRIDLDRTLDYLVEGADLLPYCDVIMGLTDNWQVPIETGGITFGFNAEGSVQAVSDPTFSHASMTPKMLSAAVKLTKQAILQTNGWLEMRVRRLFARQYASRLNAFLMLGTGANNQPTGVLDDGYSSRQTQTASTVANVTWTTVVTMQEALDAIWIPDMSRVFVASPLAYTHMRTKEREANTGNYLIDADAPKMNRMVAGDRVLRSSFLTKSPGGTAKAQILYGEFSDVQVGFWDGIEFVVDGITAPANINITMMQFWDMVLSREKSMILWTET